MNPIGFVLLTHNKPHQLLRLVNRLNSMFDFPPIAIHHDFDKCPLPDGFLSENVSFVRPHVKTGWGEFSLVEAMLAVLKHMDARADSPEWCVTLSGSCYPTKPAAQVLANLNANGYDAHLDGNDLDRSALHTPLHKEYFKRYCQVEVPYPSLTKKLRPITRHIRLPYFLTQNKLPYHEDLRCFAGSQWFSVNRRALAAILEFQGTPDAEALARHCRRLIYSDETYFQTIVFNTPGLKARFDNWLYLDWSEKKEHPKLLTQADLARIAAAPAHFARKVDVDKEASAHLMDLLDQIIDSSPPVVIRPDTSRLTSVRR